MTMNAPHYDGFGQMPIAGSWRPGTSGRELTDTDPWSGEVLTRIKLASHRRPGARDAIGR